ncbi:MAG: sulfur carrier protein ThiS [Clostridium sp.]
MKVNGKNYDFKENITALKLLEELNLNPKKVVIEVNFEIVKAEEYGSFELKENDSIEVLSFVGGG